MRDAALVGAWSGLRAASATGRPLVGLLPGCRRTYLATGHGGHGILMAALTAGVLADVMEARPNDHAAIVDPARAAM